MEKETDAMSNSHHSESTAKTKERPGSSLSVRSQREPIPSSGGGRLKHLSTHEKLQLHEEMILCEQRSQTMLDYKNMRQASKTPDPSPGERRLSGNIEKMCKGITFQSPAPLRVERAYSHILPTNP